MVIRHFLYAGDRGVCADIIFCIIFSAPIRVGKSVVFQTKISYNQLTIIRFKSKFYFMLSRHYSCRFSQKRRAYASINERRNMEYQEFVYAMKGKLNEKLGEEVTADIQIIEKNNGSRKETLLLRGKTTQTSPAVYMDEFYARFQMGEPMDRLVEEILRFYERVKTEKKWDRIQFADYMAVRGKIVFKLIHSARNEKLLQKIPHFEILDLSIVFYILLESGKAGTATVLIQNEYLDLWKVSREELYETAVKNAARLLPAEFFAIQDILEEMLESTGNDKNLLRQMLPKEDMMYVLTNSLRSFGAACMLYPHILEMLGNILNDDYYILPSSVHEVIVVPDSRKIEQIELNRMVMEINETQVESEEVLGDHAYFYQRKLGRLLMERENS